jgi:hypothetical protein
MNFMNFLIKILEIGQKFKQFSMYKISIKIHHQESPQKPSNFALFTRNLMKIGHFFDPI